MAKVWFKFGIGSMSGTVDNGVHWPTKSRINGYMRKWVLPKLTANNTLFGTIAQNLALVWQDCSVEYVADMKTYAQRYFIEAGRIESFDPCRSSYAMWLKAMWNWRDSDPTHVDLSEITVADIVALDADVRTVARMVEADFLPGISLYEDLTSGIQ